MYYVFVNSLYRIHLSIKRDTPSKSPLSVSPIPGVKDVCSSEHASVRCSCSEISQHEVSNMISLLTLFTLACKTKIDFSTDSLGPLGLYFKIWEGQGCS